MSIQFRARKHSTCSCGHLVFPGDEIRWTREQGDIEGVTLECPECNTRLRAGPAHRTVSETDGNNDRDLEDVLHPGHPSNYGDN